MPQTLLNIEIFVSTKAHNSPSIELSTIKISKKLLKISHNYNIFQTITGQIYKFY